MAVHTERGFVWGEGVEEDVCGTPCAFPARQNPIIFTPPPNQKEHQLLGNPGGRMNEKMHFSPC